MKKITIKIPNWAIVTATIIITIGFTTTFIKASGRFNLPLSWILTPSGTSVDANNNGIIDNADSVIPSGVIGMWSGTLATIPDGWQLCDGTSGTPDLRDKFVYGVSTEDPGTTGGLTSHSHTYSCLPQHTHTATVSPNPHSHSYTRLSATHSYDSGSNATRQCLAGATTGGTSLSVSISNTGSASCSTNNASNLPPYYKLAFICKD